jgi:pantetheine-phosphate adenylyltransferase
MFGARVAYNPFGPLGEGPSRMRIIAGRLGGRRLSAKVPPGTRPTSDRVREALGSVLEARAAFADASVLDLFAGSGALGLEALSRGASCLLAIDNAPAALRSLDENVRALGVEADVTQRRLDLFAAPQKVVSSLTGFRSPPFSLVFADPPYRDLPQLMPLLEAMAASELCRRDVLFVVEHARTAMLPNASLLQRIARYVYGDTVLSLLAPLSQIGEGARQPMASEPREPEKRVSAAVYAGSFDPITNGHVAVIRSGLVAFDRIIVAVLTNTTKKPLFSVDERMEMILDAVGGDSGVEVDRFDDGLLVEYAKAKGVRVLLRGLRAVGDFEHELQMANINRHLAEGIETVFIMANDYFYVSSTLIKEAAALGGDLHGMVPVLVERKLRSKFGR